MLPWLHALLNGLIVEHRLSLVAHPLVQLSTQYGVFSFEASNLLFELVMAAGESLLILLLYIMLLLQVNHTLVGFLMVRSHHVHGLDGSLLNLVQVQLAWCLDPVLYTRALTPKIEIIKWVFRVHFCDGRHNLLNNLIFHNIHYKCNGGGSALQFYE